jgi:hypothetical protein
MQPQQACRMKGDALRLSWVCLINGHRSGSSNKNRLGPVWFAFLTWLCELGLLEHSFRDATNILVSEEPDLGCFEDRTSLGLNLRAVKQTQSSHLQNLAHNNSYCILQCKHPHMQATNRVHSLSFDMLLRDRHA